MRVRRSLERGSGLLSTLFGVAVVLVAVGSTCNVCIGLWTRSTVEAVAQDAARDLAASQTEGIGPERVRQVLSRARERLGPTGKRTSMSVESTSPSVVLRVTHPGTSLIPRVLAGSASVGAIDERIVVRRELRP